MYIEEGENTQEHLMASGTTSQHGYAIISILGKIDVE